MKAPVTKRIKNYLKYSVLYDCMQERLYRDIKVIGFCYLIADVHLQFPTDKFIKNHYPELYEYKPIINEDKSYWFDRRNVEKRLHILNCIKLNLYSQLNWFEIKYLNIIEK